MRTMPLKRLASIRPSNVDKHSTEGEGLVLLCNYVDVYKNDRISKKLDLMLATATDDQIERFTLQGQDVLITKDSEEPTDIGVPAYVPEDLPGVVCGYHLALLRPDRQKLFGGYLFWALQGADAHAYFSTAATGITRYALSTNDIAMLKVRVPSIAEQERIANFLDEKTARIDALIAEKEKLLELLTEYRTSLTAAYVTGGMNPGAERRSADTDWLQAIPAHWETRRLATIFREVARPGDPSLPVLSVSIHDGISDEELGAGSLDRKITRIQDRSLYKRVAPGDLTYNMMRAWQGAFGAVAVDGLVSPAYVVAEPIAPASIKTEYIECLLRTPMAVEEMRRRSRGITDFRLRLYWDDFRDVKVCLPPIEEQLAILKGLSELAGRIDPLEETARGAIGHLREYRSSLISAAVTGRLDPSDLKGAA